MRRGEISVGDVVQAVDALAASGLATREIAELLGVSFPPRKEPLAPMLEPQVPQPAITATPPPAAPLTDQEAASFVRSLLKVLPRQETSISSMSFPLSAPLPGGGSEEYEPQPPFEPLLRAGVARAIVSHAVATRRADGPDFARVISRIARHEPLFPLPLRYVPSLRQGAQVLIDVSNAMMPFQRDQFALLAWIEKVVGMERTSVASFSGTPNQRLFGLKGDETYAPPSPGTPVVLLTDLGIGKPSRMNDSCRVEEWVAFAEGALRAHCPIVAFVPYRPARWPRSLRRLMTILQWDRVLTASRARRTLEQRR